MALTFSSKRKLCGARSTPPEQFGPTSGQGTLVRVASGIGAAILTAAVLGACSSDRSDSLITPGVPAAVCVPVGADGMAVVGLDSVVNESSARVEVTSIELEGAAGIDLIGAALVRGETEGFLGVASGAADGRIDDRHVPLEPGADATVQVTLRKTAVGDGTATALRVLFESDGKKGALRTSTTIRLRGAGQDCASVSDLAKG